MICGKPATPFLMRLRGMLFQYYASVAGMSRITLAKTGVISYIYDPICPVVSLDSHTTLARDSARVQRKFILPRGVLRQAQDISSVH